jgi:hypothetical protein
VVRPIVGQCRHQPRVLVVVGLQPQHLMVTTRLGRLHRLLGFIRIGEGDTGFLVARVGLKNPWYRKGVKS